MMSWCSSARKKPLWLLLPLLWLLVGWAVPVTEAMRQPKLSHTDRFIVSNFTDDPHQSFSHLAVDKNTGSVYVGGVNRLYHFDPNLNLLQEVTTGPVDDSIDCSPSGNNKGINLKMTDNYNKVLVIDYTRSRLIVCGTVSQGSCQVRDVRNIPLITHNVSEGIAANEALSSTVAFIAPGPPKPPGTHVLYIGVTYTGNSVYRADVPAVASRSLESHNILDYVHMEVMSSTRMFVNSLARPVYPITYVYGFGSENFSYFLTRQMVEASRSNSSPYISKLIRVCQNDSAYYSYSEIPIECKDEGGKRYNLVQAAYLGKPGTDLATQLEIQTTDDVLFAVFSPSENNDETSPKPAAESALCVYSMKSVRRMFIKNIQECFRGKGDRGLNFIAPSHPCIETRINDLDEDFCGLPINSPLGGEMPVESIAVHTFDTRLTAVAASSTEVYTVVFLGSASGHLKKVVIENQNNALEYGDIAVDEGAEVRADMFFDKPGDHIYVMTKNKISKVKTQECSIYIDCQECLGARDPYCGWCLMENKCSPRKNCRNATEDPQHWFTHKTGRCTTITQVQPSQLQRTTARTLYLVIDNLPSVKGSLQCVFSAFHKDLVTNVTRTAQGLSCTTPRNDLLPVIPKNEHHFTAVLSVRKKDATEFVSTNFTFFDCRTYVSCTECVSSPFPCDWCVDGHRCTHDSAKNCRNDVLVNGVSRMGPIIRSGPSFCPKITFVQSKEILVASGTEKSVKVKVKNVAQFITQTRFVCQFNIDGRVTSVNAQLLSDTIYCNPMDFFYTTALKSINVTFAVIWGGLKPLDNPEVIHVLVYKCNLMADNCGECLTLPEKYKCGWCQSTNQCEIKDQCESPSWQERNQTCTDIKITNFFPKSGSLDGGTNITIQGVNLGKDINDIYGGISIAGTKCQPINDSYIKTKEVTCIVDSPGRNVLREGLITLKLTKDKYQAKSKENYKFVNPVIKGIHPLSGPQSGGTKLYISGNYMNAGSKINASIAGLPCDIETTNATTAMCITSQANSLIAGGKVEMYFDNGYRKLSNIFYSYVDDPRITGVKSGRVGQAGVRDGPRGIPSGGILITGIGENFDAIAAPEIYVEWLGKKYTHSCVVKKSTTVECKSPRLDKITQKINPENGLDLQYGFIMDNVNDVRNLRDAMLNPFKLFPTPIFKKFDSDGVKKYKSDYLVIDGENLNCAAIEIDVMVQIGQGYCNVTSLSRSQLICRPPEEQPKVLDGDKFPRVVVTLGYKKYGIGFLKYPDSSYLSNIFKSIFN